MTTSIIAFIAYGVAVLAIGLWASRKSQSTPEEIHLGGREHGKWTSALSSSASTESGFVLLGMVGMGFSVGANAFWIVPAGVFGYLLMWLVLGPKLRQKSADLKVVTMPELIAVSTGGGRVSRLASVLASLLALTFLCAYVSAQFNAAGKALSVQFEMPFWTAAVTGATLVVVYALLGGFRAVSWTDNVQALMMLFALVALPVIVVAHLGGPAAMLEKLGAVDPKLTSLTGGAQGAGVLMATLPWLMLGLAYPGQPHAVARLMAAKDQSVFRPAAVIAIVWFVLIYSGAVTLGMAARAGFAGVEEIAKDPEHILPVLAHDFLPGLVAGVTVAAIMAAICSTADSTLLSAATTVVRDLRAAWIRSRTKGGSTEMRESATTELMLVRGVILLLACVATAVALSDSTGNVFGLVLYAWSGLGASLGPVTLYCALARRPHPVAALAGLLVGGTLAFAIQGHALDLLIGFSASAGAVIIVHFLATRLGATPEPVKE